MERHDLEHHRRPYRWKRVFAVIEATWHDNSCSDADQAPKIVDDTEIIYEKRASITIAEAIQWASDQVCPVTLYVYDDDTGVKAPQP